MPCDQGDADCFESYFDICGKICAFCNDSEVIHFVVAGDFCLALGSIILSCI